MKQSNSKPAGDSFMDGEAREIAEIWGKDAIAGDAIMGRLDSISQISTKLSKGAKDTPLLTFSPAIVRAKDGTLETFQSLAIIGSASIRLRILGGDVGKFFAVRFDGDEKQSSGNSMHVYTVVEKTRAQFGEIMEKAGASPDDLPF